MSLLAKREKMLCVKLTSLSNQARRRPHLNVILRDGNDNMPLQNQVQAPHSKGYEKKSGPRQVSLAEINSIDRTGKQRSSSTGS